MADPTPRVAIVGGGVTGLTVAHRLQRSDPSVEIVVLEASDRPGGHLSSVEVAGFTLDAGVDSFLGRKPWAGELCRDLGVETERPAASGTWLWTRGGLVSYPVGTAFGVPGDLGDLFRWPGLSRRGRRGALLDLVKRKRPADAGDETVGGLLRRRLGDEATDLALAPILSGLFGGDLDELSVEAAFPELRRWERTQGSLLRGAQAAIRDSRKGTPTPPLLLRPRGGAFTLAEALAAQVPEPCLRTGVRVDGVEPSERGWVVRTTSGPEHADVVVLAMDAGAAAIILEPLTTGISDDLRQIPNVSIGVVLLVYPEDTGQRIPGGTGFVVPSGRAPMTACSWISSIWPDPAFGSRAILRCSIGGAGQEDVLDAEDADIVEACARHIAALIPLPDGPAASAVIRWPDAVPRYRLGHVERVARIRERLPAGIFVSGRAFDGVDLAACVHGATQAAEGVRAFVTTDHRERIS
jgi:protoporphyrinogen/coproporphyrinogen III oxidase